MKRKKTHHLKNHRKKFTKVRFKVLKAIFVSSIYLELFLSIIVFEGNIVPVSSIFVVEGEVYFLNYNIIFIFFLF